MTPAEPTYGHRGKCPFHPDRDAPCDECGTGHDPLANVNDTMVDQPTLDLELVTPPGRLSIIPSRAVMDRTLPPPALRLLTILGCYGTEHEWVWPHQDTMAAIAGKSRQWVTKYGRVLESMGYIETERGSRSWRSGGFEGNRYRILFDHRATPGVARTPPLEVAHRATSGSSAAAPPLGVAPRKDSEEKDSGESLKTQAQAAVLLWQESTGMSYTRRELPHQWAQAREYADAFDTYPTREEMTRWAQAGCRGPGGWPHFKREDLERGATTTIDRDWHPE